MSLSKAILVTLSSEPCSGYGLAKKFDSSVGYFWRASHQQIYKELAKLEKADCLSVKLVRQEKRPDKKIYTISEKGKKELLDWMKQETAPPILKDELLVKIFAADLLPSAKLIVSDLKKHYEHHLRQLSIYENIEKQYFADTEQLSIEKKYQYLTLKMGIHYERAWLAWFKEVKEVFNDGNYELNF